MYSPIGAPPEQICTLRRLVVTTTAILTVVLVLCWLVVIYDFTHTSNGTPSSTASSMWSSSSSSTLAPAIQVSLSSSFTAGSQSISSVPISTLSSVLAGVSSSSYTGTASTSGSVSVSSAPGAASSISLTRGSSSSTAGGSTLGSSGTSSSYIAPPSTFLSSDHTTYSSAQPVIFTFNRIILPAFALDWVGVFFSTVNNPTGTDPIQMWLYVCGTQSCSSPVVAGGSLTFGAPPPSANSAQIWPLSSGSYHAFYFTDDGYQLLAGPVSFTVS